MLSLEIEPYQDHDEDAEAELVGEDSLPQQAVPTHSMILDGVLTMPGSGIEGEDEYGDEVMEGVEFSKIKRDQVFMRIDYNRRKTKIVATIGPATKDVQSIVKLLDSGMTMARVNLSHGSQKENLQLINKFKQAKRLRPYMNCALMVELRGREIRMSHINEKSGQLRLRKNNEVLIQSGQFDQASDAETIRINNEDIQRYLKPNDRAYIDDGKVVATVKGVTEQGIKLDIKIGGAVKSFSSIRFTQGKHSNLSIMTPEDAADLKAISKMCFIDFIGVPLVSQADDISTLRKKLGENGKSIHILAKIDQLESIQRYNEILDESNGIIFVRNELEWDLSAEKLMLAQKWVISQANAAAKPVIIQSQVLESMVNSEEPERKEMTEISTVCLDGVDSIMLCHETSVGKYPIAAMNQLAKSIAEAENIFDQEQCYVNMKKQMTQPGVQTIDILAHNGAQIAFEQRENVDLFVCFTENGKIARYLSKQKPKQPILACSTSGQVVRQATIMRGIVGYKIPQYMTDKYDQLVNMLLGVASEQMICNLPQSKVLIYSGKDEDDLKKEAFSFKIIGGEKPEDEEEDDDEEREDEVEQDSEHQL